MGIATCAWLARHLIGQIARIAHRRSQTFMTDSPSLIDPQLLDAHEASDISAINGIVSLANILRGRNILTDAEASALHRA
jgi:hypothetical protein